VGSFPAHADTAAAISKPARQIDEVFLVILVMHNSWVTDSFSPKSVSLEWRPL
jgi:hypothetical protein